MSFISKLSDIIFIIEKILGTILVGVMFLSLTAGVISRYYFNDPLHWPDETAVFILVWLTFIGGSMGVKKKQLAAVTLVMDMLNDRLRRILFPVSIGIVIIFGIFIFAISIPWLMQPTIALQKSVSMQLPMIYPYLSVPVGILFMVIHSLDLFLKSLRATDEEVA